MIRSCLISLAISLFTHSAVADTVVAAHTIRPQTILAPDDLAIIAGNVPGAISSIDEAVGLEARVVLYSGRPVQAGDIGPAALVDRNQIVSLIYDHSGLVITADGRSLGRAGVGDMVRVMNLSSKTTVSGVVAPDGTVHVGGFATN